MLEETVMNYEVSASALVDAALSSNDVRVYEYGVRLDPECIAAADEQVRKARVLYNNIVASMRRIHDEMQAWVIDRAGEDGHRIQARLDALNEQFAAAKAANDEPAMKAVASQRREVWKEQAACLGAVRKAHAGELRERFYSKIGRNSTHEQYRLRGEAVAAGLGWATATDVLDRALVAWKASMKLGRPPTFSRGDDKTQDSLTLQFTAAGGVDIAKILVGAHSECALTLPARVGPRQYGSFRFRLGAAAAGTDATGTAQVHRAMPAASATSARLVRRRQANKMKWALQFVLRLREPVKQQAAPSATLACVHFGWAADTDGRRVAGIADAADPGLARLVQLPTSIEDDLLRAAQIQSDRDKDRDAAVPQLKALAAQHDLLPAVREGQEDEPQAVWRAQAAKELETLRRLPAQHIAAKRFYVLQGMLRRLDVDVAWLSAWVAADRKKWQAAVGIARRARLRRREFYRRQALELARLHSAIVIEPLDLKRAAIKIDPATGERSEFTKAARAGRVVASIYEFEQEVRKAAGNYGRAIFDMVGQPTIGCCASCGANAVTNVADSTHEVICSACGAISDRKRQGAAAAWQMAQEGIEDRIVDFHATRAQAIAEDQAKSAERKRKMADGRRAARANAAASADESPQSGDSAREG